MFDSELVTFLHSFTEVEQQLDEAARYKAWRRQLVEQWMKEDEGHTCFDIES